MIPQELRTSVFQLAVQGKLVEQRPEEGTGEELFQQIYADKQALIKAGVFKKDKHLSEIAEDEIPFDIPDKYAVDVLVADGAGYQTVYSSSSLEKCIAKAKRIEATA